MNLLFNRNKRNGMAAGYEGIRLYQRFQSTPLSVADATEGVGVYFYIRGVLDALHSAVLKARLQEAIFANGEKSTDPEVRKTFARLAPQRDSANYFAPLWKTGAFDG
jgi:hypothetical protein